MKRRILLFGPNGFVGSGLRSHLPWAVVPIGKDLANLLDISALTRVMAQGDIVINAAGYVHDRDRTSASSRRLAEANVVGVANLAEAAAVTGVAQLIHISSVAAMGTWRGSGITEGMMRTPRTEYGKSKQAGEQVLAAFRDRLNTTILRPTSVFGEGRGLAAALCRVARLPLVPLPGGGQARIPFTYIGNLAHAVRLCVGERSTFGRTFIVGDRDSYALSAIVQTLGTALGKRPVVVAVPTVIVVPVVRAVERWSHRRGYAPMLTTTRLRTLTESVSYSTEALRAVTGYEPPFDLDASAARIAAWYLSDEMVGPQRS